MALALGTGERGSGQIQLVDGKTGAPACIAAYRPQAQGGGALAARTPAPLGKADDTGGA